MTYSFVSVKFSWPDEGTKVLIAVPYKNGLACYDGVVVDAGPIMRIEFSEPDFGGIDSVYRANDDRGNGWCIDDKGEEAAAFRAATTMATLRP